ncbi:hypothetical protein NYR54_17985 [Chelativorans sp. SCAU2101]|uniref:Uncharacterized protein n=1 Tax=Chelativorans petroleitrophicus TaxID=2975484 RepID=A0A9X2XC83_9HYPH|nr:hypothetical protein [Chelativorans petroleitrophicus]MCT8992156.1 hypothetical protein [Chelativorans petroleitrophicus]
MPKFPRVREEIECGSKGLLEIGLSFGRVAEFFFDLLLAKLQIPDPTLVGRNHLGYPRLDNPVGELRDLPIYCFPLPQQLFPSLLNSRCASLPPCSKNLLDQRGEFSRRYELMQERLKTLFHLLPRQRLLLSVTSPVLTEVVGIVAAAISFGPASAHSFAALGTVNQSAEWEILIIDCALGFALLSTLEPLLYRSEGFERY